MKVQLARRRWVLAGMGRLAVGAMAVASAGACDSAVEPIDQVLTTLSAVPTVVAQGDTVNLLGTAYNPTDTQVRPQSGCAPGIGFVVTEPTGASRSLYAGLAFTCPGLDSQTIEGGEVDSVAWKWRAPMVPGVYEMRAGLVTDGGLGIGTVSAPIQITVM